MLRIDFEVPYHLPVLVERIHSMFPGIVVMPGDFFEEKIGSLIEMGKLEQLKDAPGTETIVNSARRVGERFGPGVKMQLTNSGSVLSFYVCKRFVAVVDIEDESGMSKRSIAEKLNSLNSGNVLDIDRSGESTSS